MSISLKSRDWAWLTELPFQACLVFPQAFLVFVVSPAGKLLPLPGRQLNLGHRHVLWDIWGSKQGEFFFETPTWKNITLLFQTPRKNPAPKCHSNLRFSLWPCKLVDALWYRQECSPYSCLERQNHPLCDMSLAVLAASLCCNFPLSHFPKRKAIYQHGETWWHGELGWTLNPHNQCALKYLFHGYL